jgi:hypothetical protein
MRSDRGKRLTKNEGETLLFLCELPILDKNADSAI